MQFSVSLKRRKAIKTTFKLLLPKNFSQNTFKIKYTKKYNNIASHEVYQISYTYFPVSVQAQNIYEMPISAPYRVRVSKLSPKRGKIIKTLKVIRPRWYIREA